MIGPILLQSQHNTMKYSLTMSVDHYLIDRKLIELRLNASLCLVSNSPHFDKK